MPEREIYLPEVLFEFVQQGNYVKVMAVDPRTGIEVSIVGDRRAGKKTLERIAIQKLKYVIGKKINEAASANDQNLC